MIPVFTCGDVSLRQLPTPRDVVANSVFRRNVSRTVLVVATATPKKANGSDWPIVSSRMMSTTIR